MKEFVEKLIERLDKQAEKYRQRGFEHEQKGYSVMADKYYGKQCSYLYSIEIVNELAEECENDFCEWEYIDSTSYNATIPCRGNTMNIKSMRYYKFCPYCGKEIKVVE